MNTKIQVTKEAAEEFARQIGEADIDRAVEIMQYCTSLLHIEAFTPEKDQKIQELEDSLWNVNVALVKAGVYPARFSTFAEAIEELARRKRSEQLSEATIEKLSKAGAEIVLDIVTGWRRDPIPFSKEEAAYKIAKRFREIIQEGEGSPDRLRLAARELFDILLNQNEKIVARPIVWNALEELRAALEEGEQGPGRDRPAS